MGGKSRRISPQGLTQIQQIQRKYLFGGFVQFVVSHSHANWWLIFSHKFSQISHKSESCVKNRLFPADGGEEAAVCHGGEDGHDGVDEDEQVVADAVAEIEGEGADHGVGHKQK